MPRPRHPRAETREEWLQLTEAARREARFRFARKRIDKIVSCDPPLTDRQRVELARRLLPAGDAS
jgi:hypothetical protein